MLVPGLKGVRCDVYSEVTRVLESLFHVKVIHDLEIPVSLIGDTADPGA